MGSLPNRVRQAPKAGVTGMRAEELQNALNRKGLVPRGICRHPRIPDVLVVYLNEHNLEWTIGRSTRVILTVTGVDLVTSDSRSAWMLLVQVTVPHSS